MYGTSGGLQAILSHWGVNSNARAYALTFPTCVAEIEAGRPFVMRFGWASGGGHFLVNYGYDETGYLDYMDPWPGHGYTRSLYSWVVSASDHDWTHTLQVTTNPPVWNLTVASANPDSGVPITVSPSDKNGQADGATQFLRSFDNKSSVALTAPLLAGANVFKYWTGCETSVGLTCNATMGSHRALTANYVTPGEPIQFNLLKNPSFENGHTGWSESSSGGYYLIAKAPQYANDGNWCAWFGGLNYLKEKLSQNISVPIDTIQASFRFYYSITTEETEPDVFDTFKIEIRNASDNRLLQTLSSFSNLSATSGWVESPAYDLMPYKGKKIRLAFKSSTDWSYPTNFIVDNITLMVTTKLNILLPNGGETIPSGSQYEIRWSAPPEAASFDLKFSTDKGTTWKKIIKGITGSSYLWTLPLPANTKKNCLVQITAYDAEGSIMGTDRSDAVFTILR
jgi:hypothetical protein